MNAGTSSSYFDETTNAKNGQAKGWTTDPAKENWGNQGQESEKAWDQTSGASALNNNNNNNNNDLDWTQNNDKTTDTTTDFNGTGDTGWVSDDNQNCQDNTSGQQNGWTDDTPPPGPRNDPNGWDSSGAAQNQPANTTSTRALYGPHGQYYTYKPRAPDEPLPDAEEEPRYDVPRNIVANTGSTKQVLPGSGYMYWKKRCAPEYIDTMDAPYARFVFKYRTRGEYTY